MKKIVLGASSALSLEEKTRCAAIYDAAAAVTADIVSEDPEDIYFRWLDVRMVLGRLQDAVPDRHTSRWSLESFEDVMLSQLTDLEKGMLMHGIPFGFRDVDIEA